MKQLLTSLLTITLVLSHCGLSFSQDSETDLLPESIAARSEQAPAEKNLTVFLREDEPEKLTELLNKSNQEYASKGWSVFSIIPYIKNGDVDGFFVTYYKGLTIE